MGLKREYILNSHLLNRTVDSIGEPGEPADVECANALFLRHRKNSQRYLAKNICFITAYVKLLESRMYSGVFGLTKCI